MIRYVLADWAQAMVGWRFWLRFGLLDVNLKYRRTYLGPFWITLSFALSAAGLGFVYSTLFNIDDSKYIAYLVTGLAVWMFVSSAIVDGTSSLMRFAGLIRDSNIPILSHAIRTVMGSAISLIHNMVIIAGVMVYAKIVPSFGTLLIVPGIILLLINAVWMSLFFGLVCARYRDLSPLVSTVTNLCFLITPVFWYRTMLGSRAAFADVNPFYHMIELVRAPVLGNVPDQLSYMMVGGIAVVGWSLTLYVAARFQVRLAFWI
jgi:ABC-type polysaccharide/polyol phosphate export permease